MANEIDLTKSYCLGFGMFDGVHAGHQSLLKAILKDAEKYGAVPAVLTFDDCFFEVLGQSALLLTTIEEKKAILKKMGIECFTLPTTKAFLRQNGALFWAEIKEFPIKSICVGEDFTFGCDGKAATDLALFGKEDGIPVRIVPLKENERGKIASRKIRTALANGDIPRVNEELGRNYSLFGKVVHGRGEGHLFGFPTANLEYSPYRLLPDHGVYACKAIFENRSYPAVTNIGTQPTFGGTEVTIEAMIGGEFSEDIYGKVLELQFFRKLREIKKFPNGDTLRKQIEKDLSEVTI